MGRRRINGGPCIEEGCENPSRALGLCEKHYTQRRRSNQLPSKQPRITEAKCRISNCDQPVRARELCRKHYDQDQRRRVKVPTLIENQCPKCGKKAADKRHLRFCRTEPKIQPGDGDPRHGTELGYVHHKCRCKPCKRAGYEAALARRRRRGEKELKQVAAHQYHAHLRYLQRYVSMYIIAKTVSHSPSGLYYSLNQPRVSEELAEKALSTTVSDVLAQVEPTTKLRKEPYLEMVEELLRAGWKKYSICREIGYTPPLNILRPQSKFIQARFARRISYLHDQEWRNNTNNFRRHCKCIKVADPETIRNTEQKRRERNREAVARHRAKKSA